MSYHLQYSTLVSNALKLRAENTDNPEFYLDHVNKTMLEIEDDLNHKIGDEENEENERLANTVLDIGTHYEVIVLLKDELISKRGLN